MRTWAPRCAARRHSSPQPVPISSTRLPGPTRAVSSSRSILRRCAVARSSWDAGELVEQRARVCHGLVEEFGEQLVRQVVVVGDVAPGLREAVVLRARVPHHRERPEPLQRRGNEFDEALGELGEHAGQIVGVPVACHVGLAEADQAVAADPAHQRVRPVDDHRRQCRIGGADHRAVGVHAPEPAAAPPHDETTGPRPRPSRRSAGLQARWPPPAIDRNRLRVAMVPARSMVTVGRPSPLSTVSARGTTGTRRSHKRDALNANPHRAHQRCQRRDHLQAQHLRDACPSPGAAHASRRTRAGCRGAARSSRPARRRAVARAPGSSRRPR